MSRLAPCIVMGILTALTISVWATRDVSLRAKKSLGIELSEIDYPTRPSSRRKLGAEHEFEPCDSSLYDYTPCEDPARSKNFPTSDFFHRERHCPSSDQQLKCLIPPPVGYKYPIPWPTSRDEAWYVNVPHKHLTTAKADQNWIRYDESTEKFIFPGGGTMFHNGADAYLEELGHILPLTDGTIRTAIDTGCGVGSFGAYLLSRDIITMSIAPRDGHEAQVQFALERGIPAMLGVLATKRLSYPARSFDLAHCSRCLIRWWDKGGKLLAEVDRILRPGGFWVLTGPPIDWEQYAKGWARTKEDLKAEQDKIEAVAASLCWKKYQEKGMFAVWQKPETNECAQEKADNAEPPICSEDSNPDSAWYTPMETCISRVPTVSSEDGSATALGARSSLSPWPERLTAVPPRISSGSLRGIDADLFASDGEHWAAAVGHYKANLLPPLAEGSKYRNVMDMNAGLGGFAAALGKDPVWVMNVVPVAEVEAGRDTLGAVFERGLLGTYQDWCEAFSTYPRTYDLIHAAGVFKVTKDKCPLDNVLLEMDRILRPEGAVIIRGEDADLLEEIKGIAQGMRWDARIEDAEEGATDGSKVLVCVKKYWTAS